MQVVSLTITVMRSDRGKYAIDFPTRGTAEENQATAQGTHNLFRDLLGERSGPHH